MSDFERVAAETAVSKGYSHIVCGHIHQPEIKRFAMRKTKVTYLNSGDWVENSVPSNTRTGNGPSFDTTTELPGSIFFGNRAEEASVAAQQLSTRQPDGACFPASSLQSATTQGMISGQQHPLIPT